MVVHGGGGGGQTTFAQAARSPNDNPWRIDYGKIMSVYVGRDAGVLNRPQPDDEIMSNIRSTHCNARLSQHYVRTAS